MSSRPVTQFSATQSHASTKADRIREMAKAEPGKAQVVKMNGKEYYVVKITDGNIVDIPNAARVKDLAKLVIEAHTKGFEHIDSQGAHYADGRSETHTEKRVDQQELHKASEGVSVANPQLTNPQQAAVTLDAAISSDKTAGEVRSLLLDPELPQEFTTALTTLVHGKADEVNIPQAEIQQAFDTARDTQYIPRLQQEHVDGRAPGVETDFASVASKPTTGEKLLQLNTVTVGQRTAQHAWNAMLKEAHVTQRTSLPQILGEDMHIVEVHPHHEVDPLHGIEIAALEVEVHELLGETVQVKRLTQEAQSLGINVADLTTAEALTQAITDKYREHVQAIKDTGEREGYTWNNDFTWKQNIPQNCVGKNIEDYTLEELKEFVTRYNLTAVADEMGLLDFSHDFHEVGDVQKLTTKEIAERVFAEIQAKNPNDTWKAYLPDSLNKEEGFTLDELKVIIFRRAAIMEADNHDALKEVEVDEIRGLSVPEIEGHIKGHLRTGFWHTVGRPYTYDEALFQNPFGLRALQDLAKID